MVEVGQIYEDKNTLYEVVRIHFHWETRKRVVEFISLTTGSFYVLEEEKFLQVRKLTNL